MKCSHVIDVFFGTGFIQEAKKVFKFIKNILEERRKSPEKYRGDFIDQAINDMKTEKIMTDDQIVYVVAGIWMATWETSSTLLALIFNFLAEYPSVAEELRVCIQNLITIFFMNNVIFLYLRSI